MKLANMMYMLTLGMLFSQESAIQEPPPPPPKKKKEVSVEAWTENGYVTVLVPESAVKMELSKGLKLFLIGKKVIWATNLKNAQRKANK